MSGFAEDNSITDELSLDDFAYDLPADLIAQEPAEERSSSRLMILSHKNRSIEHHHFSELTQFLRPGDLLVLNDTKVIPARILACMANGRQVEILLLKPEATKPGVWQAMANPLRKLKVGNVLNVETADGAVATITISDFFKTSDGQRRALVDFGGQAEVHKLLSRIGLAPLPPYIVRERTIANLKYSSTEWEDPTHDDRRSGDLERYQTVYAKTAGAVAAPTAGLHFSQDLLQKVTAMGVEIAYLTLHVGPGTFKPITTSLAEHTVEAEEFYIPEETVEKVKRCRANGGRIIAVGTTSCRALETAGSSGTLAPVSGMQSHLYIRPGYKFSIVDALITNFHLSKSSLLVLVSAFCGHDFIMAAYAEAIAQRYRFYSYGDAMFIT